MLAEQSLHQPTVESELLGVPMSKRHTETGGIGNSRAVDSFFSGTPITIAYVRALLIDVCEDGSDREPNVCRLVLRNKVGNFDLIENSRYKGLGNV
jgi:hypothetical protein